MAENSKIDQYRKGAVTSASPLQLVVMLYDGALRHLEGAKLAIKQGNLFEQNASIQKAQRIITELLTCLDMEKGAEIAQNLFALYTFCYNRLVDANVQDNAEAIDQVIVVLTDLRSGWAELEQNLRNQANESSAA